jgi:glycosyltransferase involved in cell wall biosynthesis
MIETPRVALFADTFHEINGAANVLRRLVNFARENDFPLMCVRAGQETSFCEEGSLQIYEFERSRLSIPVDGELRYDPLFWRFRKLIGEKLREFRPNVIHLTGLNDVSQLGFFFAHYNRTPAVASWHTNTHEYAARRLGCALKWLPSNFQKKIDSGVQNMIMTGLMKLYFLAQVQLAPNVDLVEEIQKKTRRPSFLMSRGVDTEFLCPSKRRRKDSKFVLGYVGRLRPEKNVRFFADVEKQLADAGIDNYKIVMVGEGGEDEWLKNNLKNVELAGVLRGEKLAEAYADMDLFVFPSRTDAFGNVVLEAMAAGVPAVVMPEGGPRFLIENGVNGVVASCKDDFLKSVVELVRFPQRVEKMREAAREAACERSWERVFESVYDKYQLSTTVAKNVRV